MWSTAKPITPAEMEGLRQRIEKNIRETLNFRAVVKLLPPGSVVRTAVGKVRRVLRQYDGLGAFNSRQ